MYASKKSTRKLIALVLLLALLVGGTVGGTFAWLITQSNTVTNTFTEGNINISLKEHELDPQTGEQLDKDKWVETQEIELLPGRTVYKDPTVFVEAGSEPCYVRMYMIIDYQSGIEKHHGFEAIKDWFEFSSEWIADTNAWVDKTGGIHGHVIEFTYNQKVTVAESGDPTALVPLFESITIPSDLSGEKFDCLKEAKLFFVAQAVQDRGSVEDSFAEVGYPEITLNMYDDNDITLDALIERNKNQKTSENS